MGPLRLWRRPDGEVSGLILLAAAIEEESRAAATEVEMGGWLREPGGIAEKQEAGGFLLPLGMPAVDDGAF